MKNILLKTMFGASILMTNVQAVGVVDITNPEEEIVLKSAPIQGVSTVALIKAPVLEDTHINKTLMLIPALRTDKTIDEEETKETQKPSLSWNILKGISGFVGVTILTDPLTNIGCKVVNAGISAVSGKFIGKIAEIALHSTIYDNARTTAFLAGWKTPDLTYSLIESIKKPKKAMSLIKEIGMLGIQATTTSISSYLLTQPVVETTSNIAYYMTLYATGNPFLAYGAYYGTKGAVHYTGVAAVAAKYIGYNAPAFIEDAYSGIKTLFQSDKMKKVTSKFLSTGKKFSRWFKKKISLNKEAITTVAVAA